MNKKEIFKQLETKEPSKIGFHLENEILKVDMDASSPNANMQTDESAFEGWILIIMLRLGGRLNIKRVVLHWEDIDPNRGAGHYSRFIYRVLKFRSRFSEWFDVDSQRMGEVARFQSEHFSSLLINFPKSESKQEVGPECEAYLERLFIKQREIKRGVVLEHQNHQLPVGIFEQKISRKTALFTGGKSAIDIWGVRNDELWIFELKFGNNSKVGIISELLFYMWVMEDVFLLKKIHYPVLTEKKLDIAPRDFSELRKRDIKFINGVMLAEKLHPMVD